MPQFEIHLTISNPFRFNEFSEAVKLLDCKPIFIKLRNSKPEDISKMKMPFQAMLGYKQKFDTSLEALNFGKFIGSELGKGDFKTVRIKVETFISYTTKLVNPKYFEAHFKFAHTPEAEKFCLNFCDKGLYFSEGIGDEKKFFLTERSPYEGFNIATADLASFRFSMTHEKLKASAALAKVDCIGAHFETVWEDTCVAVDEGWFAPGGYSIK